MFKRLNWVLESHVFAATKGKLIMLIGIVVIVFVPFFSKAGDAVDSTNQYARHTKRAHQFEKLSIFAEAISEWKMALEVADSLEMKEEYLSASISLAELMRKTMEFDQGLEILTNLQGTEAFPSVHVRKLGRLAALYHEVTWPEELHSLDSVKRYLDSGIAMAIQLDLPLEEASLKNELGYFISRNIDPEKGYSILKEAALLFKLYGDDQNFVGAMTNMLRNCVELENIDRADSIISVLLKEVKGKGWFDAEIGLYRIIANRYSVTGDSTNQQYWETKVTASALNWEQAVNSQKMVMFRVLYDTKKYQDEAEKSGKDARLKEAQLALQTTRTRTMAVFILILGGFVLAVVVFLFKERKLRRRMNLINQELQVANEKYHTLIVESNHRIKNNLQMILSMLQYASKDKNGQDIPSIKGMMSKIHTISALHKHLYADIHNVRVDLETYFTEIISLYTEMGPSEFFIEKRMDSVGIQSERIIYFGLVFNEMLSNTLEHSTVNLDQVKIHVQQFSNYYNFTYQDGSIIDTKAIEGTGSRLIRQLIQRVGGVEFLFDPTCGKYQFQFYA